MKDVSVGHSIRNSSFTSFLFLMENYKFWLVIALWDCFQHTKPICFLSFPSSSFPLVFFWPQRFTAAFSILSSLCDTLPSHCFSPHTLPTQESQLPSTLGRNYTNIQMQARTQALTCTPRCARTHITLMGWCICTYTKGILDHLCGMFESLKKWGCVVITTALHPQWNLSGQVVLGEGRANDLGYWFGKSPHLVTACTGEVLKLNLDRDKSSCCRTRAIRSFHGGRAAGGE